MKKIGEYACFSLEGTMHPNEDRWVALKEWEYEKDKEHYVNGGREKIEEGEDTPSEGESDDKVCRPSYFAMYDGHGGNMAVEYIIGTLHKHIINADTRSLFYLTEDQPVNEEGISEAIKKGFEKTEAEVLKYTLDHKDASGSCAVVAIVVKSTLFVANVGDSRAVLGRRKPGTSSPWADKSAGFIDKLLASYKPIGMTLDQKATTPSEKKRMIQAGGWLFQGRVWGNLAVARSFGDRTLKGPAYTKAFSPESIKKRKANALRREALAQQQQQQGGAEGGTATNSKTGSPVSSRKEREEKKKRNKAKDSPGSGVKIETETAAEDLQEKEKEKEKKKKKKKKQQQEEEEDNSEDEEVRLAIKKEKERLRTETVIIEEDDESLVKESLKLATSQKKKITTATSAEGSEEVVTKKKKSKSKLTVETNESEAVTPKSPRKASKENNISNNEEEIKKEDNEQQQHKEEDTTATTATTEPTELTEREKKRIARRAEALAKEQEKLLKIQERVLEKRRKLMEKRNTKIQLLVAQKGPSKAGVIIAEPVIKVYHFHPKDDFIVMATDGLWDVVDNNQVVTIIGKRLLKQKSFSAYGLPPPKLVDTCRSICNRARDKHSYDDITTLIFTLKDKDDNNTTNTLTSPSTPSLPSTDSEDELKDSEEEVEEEVVEEDEDEETSTDSSE